MDVSGKVEDALVIVGSDGGLEALGGLWQGHDFEEHPLPYFGFYCQDAAEIVPQSGSYRCKVKILIKSSADRNLAADSITPDPVEKHNALVSALGDVFLVEQTGSGSLVDWRDSAGVMQLGLLTKAVEDFTATMIVSPQWSRGNDGRAFWTTLEFELFCCPSRLG